MSLGPATRQQLDSLIGDNPVMLFMKGNRQGPQCGFSATVIRILDSLIPDYQTFDVLSDMAVRDGIKEYSTWPTIPQLYVNGEFIGGCDIIQELHESGELLGTLGVELPDAVNPTVTITDAAAKAIVEATAGAGSDQTLQLGIDARFQSSLFMAPRPAGSLEIDANGTKLTMDRLTAQRADGITIDVTKTPGGIAFRVHIPNAPSQVHPLSVAELKQRLDAGEHFEFVDVRTPEERARASISGTRLISPEESTRLESLAPETMLVFHCHHGGRSQAAGEHFASLGFTNVWNVVGGIDAWSQEIDPEVPRY